MNERRTEDIVRSHFKDDTDYKKKLLIIEEQGSEDPTIQGCLEKSSKHGNKRGIPDFIIRNPEYPDLILVVECKANYKKHSSKDLNKPKEFAVDGACHYASFLSKEFNVVSIGVSGEESLLNVTHHLHKKGDEEKKSFVGTELLSFQDYYQAYKMSLKAGKKAYEKMIDYASELNQAFHDANIKEEYRSEIISGILLALEKTNFYHEFYGLNENELCPRILELIDEAISKSSNKKTLKRSYESLFTDTNCINALRDKTIIKGVVDSVYGLKSTYSNYSDIIGQFYIEFLKYSNSGKSLGIVLTPHHITNFFCDLADIRKGDIVYDPCVGTGGFLVSAMGKMIQDAKGDKKEEKKIKEDRLFGIEDQQSIFTLVWANMFLHGDGRSNIFKGDCLDPDNALRKSIDNKKPTVALMNPPFKGKESKKGTEELQFVYETLEFLGNRGRCVAIVPMSCVIGAGGKHLRKKILEHHTLEACLSMPNELFFNSKTNVVTSVLILTAHVPHQKNDKVFLGYFKDDGFTKRKQRQRYDYDRKWEDIKKKWLSLFRNKEQEKGLSLVKLLSYDDEWCAEAYMESDYTNLTREDFVCILKNFSAYQFLHKNRDAVDKPACGCNLSQEISLKCEEWKTFKFTDIFSIKGTHKTKPRDVSLLQKGVSPYVCTQATNNGVKSFHSEPQNKGGVLTIDSACVGYCAYQAEDFLASDHVEQLILKSTMNVFIAMFLVTVINFEAEKRYSYGRKASQTRLKKASIQLPVTKEREPDWQFMEKYIKSLPYSNNLIR